MGWLRIEEDGTNRPAQTNGLAAIRSRSRLIPRESPSVQGRKK